MTKANLTVYATLLATFAFHAAACSVPVSVSVALPISTIPGALVPGAVGNLLPSTGFDLPIQEGARELPPGSHEIHLTAVQIRSVLADDSDRTEEARKNPDLIMECPEGRAKLGFVESVSVKIKHRGEADSAAVEIASYKRPTADYNPCGIALTTDSNVDLKSYVDGYEIMTTATGKSPQQDVQISGYIELTDNVGL
jgi:hypothetical protein